MKLSKKQRLLLRKKRMSKARHKRRKEKFLMDNIVRYRNDPVEFLEDYLGIKLNSFQKALLKCGNCMSMMLPIGRKHGYHRFVDVVDEYNKIKEI